MSRNLINDGYTKTGYIEESEGLHESLRFEFRPMLPEEVEDSDAKIQKLGPRDSIRLIAALCASKVVEWSEVDDKGSMVEITPGTVGRLPYTVLGRMHRIVAGVGASDPLPHDDQTDEEPDILRIVEGINGQAELEADRKN